MQEEARKISWNLILHDSGKAHSGMQLSINATCLESHKKNANM